MKSNKLQYYEGGISGAGPGEWFGPDAPDGDRGDWATAPVGSEYVRKTSTGATLYTKVKSDGLDDDWAILDGCISVTVKFSQFTDGGAAAGTYTLAAQLPVGAVVERAVLVNVTGFAGNTSAVITVGDGTDVDRYNTGTPSVFASAAAVDLGAPSGAVLHTAAVAPVITITSASDFTAVNAGQLTLRIYY